MQSEFSETVRKILSVELPRGKSVIREGHSIAREIKIGRSAFLIKMGFDSEEQYKRCCMKENRIMYHAHIGMGSWDLTADALEDIYERAEDQDMIIDRAGICLDRRMGLPRELWDKVPAETGPMLSSPSQWQQVGGLVPIQPHMGDFIIGFPASTENTIHSLSTGATTIGNLSQFFSHEAPQWRDHIKTTVETVKSMSIMGALREKGVLLHSYLEDGYGALFDDLSLIHI